MSAAAAQRLLGEVADTLVRRGVTGVDRVDGTLYISTRGHKLKLLTARSTGYVKLHDLRVWDGHGHSPIPGHPADTVQAGTARGERYRLASLIIDRLRAWHAALDLCVHRAGKDGSCAECGLAIPTAPPGTDAALVAAAEEMAGRRRPGVFVVAARGASLRVEWKPADERIWSRCQEAALRVAAAHLRAAGLSADVVLGAEWIALSVVAAADERTCLDAVRDEEPLDAAAE